MGDKQIPDYAEAMSRIQLVTGCGTQQELAAFFGIRQSSISDAKKAIVISNCNQDTVGIFEDKGETIPAPFTDSPEKPFSAHRRHETP